MTIHALGRPPDRAAPAMRHDVLAYLFVEGPAVGLPTLRSRFPDVARGELLELQRRYRSRYVYRHRFTVHALRWTWPGAVWAIDHTWPIATMPGGLRRIFAVRDVALPMQLAAVPTPDESGVPVRAALDALVAMYGAPLVIKLDNSGAFRSQAMKDWASHNGIVLLYSPPWCPEYNGAAEAGIGHVLTHTLWEATRRDRPTAWTCDDVMVAVERMNACVDRTSGLSARERWLRRSPIETVHRDRFQEAVRTYHVRETASLELPDSARLDHWQQARIDRHAISRALMEHGYLVIRKRRIPPRFRRRKADNIS